MEFANENLCSLTGRNNLKSQSVSFPTTNRSVKKALSDVRNIIHSKNFEKDILQPNISKISTYLCIDDLDRDLKSPSPRKKKTNCTKSKKSTLDTMSDNCFTNCRCCIDFDGNYMYTLPADLNLTKNEIDIFATNWVNNGSDFADEILTFSPVELDADHRNMAITPLNLIMEENESYLHTLNESFDIDILDMLSA